MGRAGKNLSAVLLIPELDAGGPDRVFYDLSMALPDFGVSVEVVVFTAGGRYWELLPEKVNKTILIEGGDARRYPVKEYADYMKVAKPDIVLSTLRGTWVSTAARFRYREPTPLVLRPANHISRNTRELLRQSVIKHSISFGANVASLHIADHLISQSSDLTADFRFYGVPKRKISTIGNPISLPDLNGFKSEDESDAGHITAVAVGRLTHQKGFDLLIDAVALVRETLPTFRLRILGEGPCRHELEEQVTRLGLGECVSLPGHSKSVLQDMYSASFVVSSSRYEGFPNVLLEAMSVGTPVLASDCPGGTNQMVLPKKTGWLCRSESPSSLAAGLVEAAAEFQQYDRAGLRAFVAEVFSVDKIAGEYAEVLKHVHQRCHKD